MAKSPQTKLDIVQQYADLPREIQPKRELWSGIEQGISEQECNTGASNKRPSNKHAFYEQAPNQRASSVKHKSRFVLLRPQFMTSVAAFAAVAMFAVLLMVQLKPESSDSSPLSVPSLAAQMNQDFATEKAKLLQYVSAQPAYTDNWQAQLDELERAAAVLSNALSNDPNNMALIRMLNNVQQQQIDLIEKVHAPKWQRI